MTRTKNEVWKQLEAELELGLPANTLSKEQICEKWRQKAINAEKKAEKTLLKLDKTIDVLTDISTITDCPEDWEGLPTLASMQRDKALNALKEVGSGLATSYGVRTDG